MPNYENGKVYKLISPSGLTYIGSTTQSLAKRKAGHKRDHIESKKGLSGFYTSSSKLFDESLDNIDIVLIESVPCRTKEELYSVERKWIESVDCVNKKIPTRTQKEYREANKEEIKQKKKVYAENHKEEIKQKKKAYFEANKEEIRQKRKQYRDANKDTIAHKLKQYYENNKEKLRQKKQEYHNANKDTISQKKKEYRQNHKEEVRQQRKEYREANKEIIAQTKKEYYEANKDTIKESTGKQINCECGSTIRKGDISRHKRTAKHQNHFINQQNQSK
jgi:hypothetical protein